MRILALGVVVVVQTAHADPKPAKPKPSATPDAQVEKLVRTNIAAASRDGSDFGVTSTAVIYLPMGNTPVVDESQRLRDNFYSGVQADVKHDVDKVIVSVDSARGIAWFQASYRITIEGRDPDDKPFKTTSQARAGGVAVPDGSGWKIQAIAYGDLIADKNLVTDTPRFKPTDEVKGGPTFAGDAALGKAVAGWFGPGFASQVAANATAIATGSSPAASELQSGAGVDKLVKSWDALKLQAREITARLLPGGNVGFVKVEVAMPVKKSKRTAPLLLYVVAVKDGSDWKWVSLQYASGMGP